MPHLVARPEQGERGVERARGGIIASKGRERVSVEVMGLAARLDLHADAAALPVDSERDDGRQSPTLPEFQEAHTGRKPQEAAKCRGHRVTLRDFAASLPVLRPGFCPPAVGRLWGHLDRYPLILIIPTIIIILSLAQKSHFGKW